MKTKVILSLLLSTALCACQDSSSAQKQDAQYCGDDPRNLALINGQIHTMDDDNSIVSSVYIKNGYVASLGADDYAAQDCTDVIDLGGRTAIPGLIDNHVHFVRTQNLPGIDMRDIEATYSHADVFNLIKDTAADQPAGTLLTGIGGFKPAQWTQNSYPSMADLDAAAPDHPVYISEFGFGPGQTNTAARDLLRSLGASVSDDGLISPGPETAKAYEALAANRTPADMQDQLRRVTNYANKMGLTTVMDMSGTIPGVGFIDQRTGYAPIAQLARDGALNIRTRLFIPALDEDADLAQLTARLDNSLPNFGSDMLKVAGIGEWSVGRALFNEKPLGKTAYEAQRRIAERGWSYQQHLHSPEEFDAHLDVWEQLDKDYDLAALRWTPGHLSGVTQDALDRINALGLGVGAHGQPYLDPLHGYGPPWRMILDSNPVAIGAGSDGARISPMNPWSIISYAVTGKNYAGELVNADQAITRMEAVKLYTSADQGWFTKEDDTLGGIAQGRYGDIAVLPKNIFDANAVPDDDIRRMQAMLTIVGGRIVYSDGTLTAATQ